MTNKYGSLLAGVVLSLACSPYADALVSERSYRMSLKPELFAKESLSENIVKYQTEFVKLIQDNTELKAVHDLHHHHTETQKYYDIPLNCDLSYKGLQLIDSTKHGHRELNLIYKDSDQFISFFNVDKLDNKGKFYEEIHLPYQSQFKYLSMASLEKDADIRTIKDIEQYLPALASYRFNQENPVDVVNSLELVLNHYTGTTVNLNGIEGVLSLYIYYQQDNQEQPVFVEATFDYKDADRKFSKESVNNAKHVYLALQAMNDWNTFKPDSISNYIYSYGHYCM